LRRAGEGDGAGGVARAAVRSGRDEAGLAEGFEVAAEAAFGEAGDGTEGASVRGSGSDWKASTVVTSPSRDRRAVPAASGTNSARIRSAEARRVAGGGRGGRTAHRAASARLA
jgi:hypothetical protein